MITVAAAVKQVITHSPLLEEGLSRDILNVSSVARSIKKHVEDKAKKEVSIAAIIMAIKRLQTDLPPYLQPQQTLTYSPDIIIRSGLIALTYDNSRTLNRMQQQLLTLTEHDRSHAFLTMTSGVFETTIIASSVLGPQLDAMLAKERIISRINDLSSVTIRLSEEMIAATGSVAHILRQLAWENIPLVEIVSTNHELTIIIKSIDTDRTLVALRSLS
jgi:hypothetical protein